MPEKVHYFRYNYKVRFTFEAKNLLHEQEWVRLALKEGALMKIR